MTRNEEYWALKQQLSQWPEALDGTAERARRRARRHRAGKRFGISLGSVAGICAAFVIAVNVLPTFALACGKVPVLRELAAAVAFSPSLSAAVAHDYVQYVGQSRTADGVTVTVEYVIADEQQMVVFYRTDGAEDCQATCRLQSADGGELEGYAVTNSGAAGDLKRLEIHFTDLTPPEDLVLELRLYAGEKPLEGTYVFSLHLDPEKTAEAVEVPVDTWVELDGRRLMVESLTLTPTRTVLHLVGDPENDAWLQSLDFHFTDGDGNVYGMADGSVTAMGEPDTPGFYTYYFQSLYFLDDPSDLTLCIDGAVWLDKSGPTVTVDLADGTWEGALPEGAGNLTVERSGGGTVLTVETADVDHSPLDYGYRDGSGEEKDLSGFGVSESWTDDDGVLHPRSYSYRFPSDAGETVELKLGYTDFTKLETPLEIPIP